jgi:flagellin
MIDSTGKASRIPGALSQAIEARDRTMEKLATTKQINRGSDDPAGLAVLMSMEAQSRGLMREILNRQDEVSLLQTAEGAMGSTTEALQRIRELAVQAGNGILTDEDRSALQAEVGQLRQHIDQTANHTSFNTKTLLDGSFTMSLQNGDSLGIPAMTSAGLNLGEIDISTAGGAGQAIGFADAALQQVSSERSRLGAVENGIVAEASSLHTQMIDTLSAQSRIGDLDIAKALIDLTTSQIKTQVGLRMFRFDDERRQTLLQLLG